MTDGDRGQRRTIVLLSAAAFSSAASLRACDSLLPALVRGFGITTGQAAHTISIFALAYGLTQMLYGPLGDRYGKLRVIAWAAAAGVAASLGAMVAPGIGWLIGFRALGGAAAAAMIPLSMAWIGDQIAYEHRQATLARFLMGQMLGVVSGQFLGGVFADHLGWRWTFGFLAATFLASAIALWAQASSFGDVRAGPSVGFASRIAAIARAGWPRVIFVAVFFEGLAVFGALAFIPWHLHHRFGVSLTLAGLAPGAFGLGGIGYALYARRLVARLGETGLVRAGAACLTIALIGLALGGSWLLAVPESALLGIGYYMLHNTLQTHATQMAPANRGTAVSLFASSFFLGQATGVSIASVMADSVGTAAVFAAAALLLLTIGTAFAVALRRRPMVAQ
ncbi:MAG TPA: MFS transporter [Burkholderiaceae bacterium]|nr:MFS transporter [Burkholderiaceae bacterium]